MKSNFKFLVGLMLTLVALFTGAPGHVMMADATNLPDAGVTASGDGNGSSPGGIATETQGREDGDA